MVTKEQVIEAARGFGFGDVGFTSAEPFSAHRECLAERSPDYDWAAAAGLALEEGTDPCTALPGARTVIVLIDEYFREAFPHAMESHFGRCYLDDDRVTRDGLALRIKAFRSFLRVNGVDSKVPFNVPHRVAAARAGLGTFGKNCLFYAGRVALGSSWVTPFTVVVDREFEPDAPTVRMGCPEWCRNACVAACPTRALKGNGVIDPRRCISYLTYFGHGITPRELREPMGLCVYGCDRCQNVCPRNQAWLSRDLPLNSRVAAKAGDFGLTALLHMDREYFTARIWPHMFYISPDNLWKWKMNVARVMGNTVDPRHIPELRRAYGEEGDERVRGMIAWALGRIGGAAARRALEDILPPGGGSVREEILAALEGA